MRGIPHTAEGSAPSFTSVFDFGSAKFEAGHDELLDCLGRGTEAILTVILYNDDQECRITIWKTSYAWNDGILAVCNLVLHFSAVSPFFTVRTANQRIQTLVLCPINLSGVPRVRGNACLPTSGVAGSRPQQAPRSLF